MGKKEYMEILLSQIRNDKAKEFVGEEIAAHIDDQADTYMEFGLDPETAEKKAVRSMGDPVETGVSLDRIHKPKMSWSMIGLVAILCVFGLVLQFLVCKNAGDMYYFQRQIMFVIIGFIAMLFICFIDYSRFVQRGREIAVVYLLFCLLAFGFGNYYNGTNMYVNLGPVTFSMHFAMYLSIPIFGSLLYLYRNQKKRHLLIPVGFMVVLFLIYYSKVYGFLLVTNIWVIAGIVLTYALAKNWYPVNRKRAIGILWGILLGVPAAILGAVFIRMHYNGGYSYLAHRIYEFFYGDGAYVAMNGQYMKIHDILENLCLFGGRASNQAAGNGLDTMVCDYVLLHTASCYGTFILISLIALLGIFCYKIFHTAIGQKNQVGTIIGIGCGMIFTVQIAEYVMMNLGLIPGTTVYLPFVSHGGSGTIVSFILLGLLLSIYRYQNLVTDKKVKRKRIILKVIEE